MADPVTAVAVEIAKAPSAITIGGYVMMALGGLFLIFLVYVFWHAQRDKDNRIDLADLLIDFQTGKTSQGRFWSLIGGTAGTWVFLYLPVSGHFDAGYAAAYLAAVFALKVAGDITGKPVPGASSSVTTTTSTVQAAVAPAANEADALLAAGRGVEPLSPKISANDVGKSVLLARVKPTANRKK